MVATETFSIGSLRGVGWPVTSSTDPNLFHRGSGTLSRSMREELPDSAFALPKLRKYPVISRGHAISAKARATQGLKRGWINKTEYKNIVSKANKFLNKN